jgi:hypothetical protein
VFSYAGTDIGPILRQLSAGAITKERIAEIERRYAKETLLAFDGQQSRFLTALGLARQPQRQPAEA